MIYATDLPYTVPSPMGKSPGVGGDGRLHALYVVGTLTASGEAGGIILRYELTGARFDWRIGNQATSVPLEGGFVYAQLQSEPTTATFSGETFGEPLQLIGMGSGGGFRWLPAGTTISVLADPDLGPISIDVVGCLVEDFGQLAQGEEYTGSTPRQEVPVLLLRES